MMFRMAPTSLAVLAVINVATSLASPVAVSSTDKTSHRELNDGFSVNFYVPQVATESQFYDIKMEYIGVNGNDGYGCGAGNKKCYCRTTQDGALHMVGVGTSGSATGLEFTCAFAVEGDLCTITVYLEYYSSTNTLTCKCGANNENFKFEGCDIGDGRSFPEHQINLVKVPPKDLGVELVKNEAKMVESAISSSEEDDPNAAVPVKQE